MNNWKIRVGCLFLCLALAAGAWGQDQLLNLPDSTGGPRFALTGRVWPAAHGEMSVCLWEDDKIAAVSITIDDNNAPEHSWWLGLGQKYGWRFTWFTIVWPYMYDYDYSPGTNQSYFGTATQFQTLFAAGHAVQGHGTMAINTLSLDAYEHDLRFTKELLEDYIPGNRVLTYAYPDGDFLGGKDEAAARIFIGARSTVGIPNPPNNIRYMHINSGILSEGQLARMITPGDQYYRGWINPLIHLVGVGAEVVDKAASQQRYEYTLDYLKSLEKSIWVGLFNDIAMYGQERDSLTLAVSSVSADIITFTLSDRMDDGIFTQPLSVKVRVDNDWEEAAAVQNGTARSVRLYLHEGHKYALVKAVPDKGLVTLSRVTPVEAAVPVIAPDNDAYYYLYNGNYRSMQEVTITTVTNNADIFYTLDGSLPGTDDFRYTGPFVLDSSVIVRAVVWKAGLVPSGAASADIRIDTDRAAPQIAAVSAWGNLNQVTVSFSEAVNRADAENTAYYSIDQGVFVTGAVLLDDQKTVQLGVSTLTLNAAYTLLVSGISDSLGNRLVSAQASFTMQAAPVMSGLTGCWYFDEAEGVPTLFDASGNSHPGAVYGAERCSGVRGNALSFDGHLDYATLNNTKFGINTTNQLTISFWFNIQGGSLGTLVERNRGFSDPYRIDCLPDRHVRTIVRTDNTHYLTGNAYLLNNTWYHYSLTYSNGERIAYLNGNVDVSDAVSGLLEFEDSVADTVIGINFQGYMDEVMIFNRALSAGEILSLYGGEEWLPLPVASPQSGSYPNSVTVALAAGADTDIRYTLDGSEPNRTSALYVQPFVFTQDAVIKAVAYKGAIAHSQVATFAYAIYYDTIPPVVTAADALNANQLSIDFSEALDPVTSRDTAHYSIDNGITVTAAVPDAVSASRVILTVGTLADNITYTLTCRNVQDLAGNSMQPAEFTFIYSSTQPEPGLTAYWKLDEGSGTIARDASGFANHGTLNGAAWITNGYKGNALYFDGSGTVNCGTGNFGIGATNTFTVSLWFKRNGASTGYALRRGAYGYPFWIEAASGERITGLVRTDNTYRLTSNNALQSGVWYHVALSYQPGSRVLYINGQPDNSDDLSGTLTLGEGSELANTLLGENFNGWLDEIKIYNRVLSASEIQVLYAGGELLFPPEIEPAAGVYPSEIMVSMSSSAADAEIRYTLDGSEPVATALLYTGPFYLMSDAVVKARCFKSGILPSGVTTRTYSINIDYTPPAVTSLEVTGETSLVLALSEAVAAYSAGNLSCYSIDNGLAVNSASLSADGTKITLTTTPLQSGINFTLTVQDLLDLAGNRMGLTTVSFSYVPPQTEPGLAGYWKCDEGAGNTLLDASGNAANGVLNGAVWSGDAHRGSSLYFDGNDTVNLGTSRFGLNETNSFTISLWFKRDGATGGYLIRRGTYGYPFWLESASWNKVIGLVRTSNTSRITSNANVSANTWYHAVLTYQSGTRILYINGQVDKSDVVSGSLNFGDSSVTTLLGENYRGWIDELKVYHRVLSLTEIQALYTN